jgi:DNA replication protein DnaC
MEQTVFSMSERSIVCSVHGQQTERGIFGKWFGCPVCNEDRLAAEEREAFEQAKLDNIKSAGIPSLYDNSSLKSWHITDERQQRILMRAMEYAKTISDLPAAPNFVLSGTTGTGKTHIAASVLRMAARQSFKKRLLSCQYVTGAQIMAEIRASWDAKTRSKHESEILRHYGSVKVLVIDEIGVSDRINGSQDIWSTIFDMRYREKLPTIITSNLDKAQLQHHIGDRAYDRLMERCVWANCAWQSYRQFCADVEEL